MIAETTGVGKPSGKAQGMKHLSILHLINNFGDSSITRIVRDLVRHLGQEDFTWHVGGLSGVGDMQDEFGRLGAKVIAFADADARPSETMRRIRDYVAENRIEIVHTHTPRAILMLRLALGRGHRQLHVATKHILNSPGDRRWGMLYSLADRLLLYSPNHLIAVSGKVYREIMACPAIDTARVSMIHNAVDHESFHAPGQREACRAEFGLAPDIVVIGSSGRLEKVKRYDLMLQAFAAVNAGFPGTRLMIIGDGSLKSDLEKLAEKLGVADAVIWTGFRRDIPRLLAAMDIYLQSSVNEGMSLSILEAMAAGKPVVITDVGGARELVEDGRTGVLIPAGSAPAITTALTELLEDPEKRYGLALAGREYITREFGVQQMMESYRRVYETVTSRA
jgi:glycosyltransferase involved in cell wall biosynthesis